MKTVVLTFDDGDVTHRDFVAPTLKKYNFTGTFFVTEALMDQVTFQDLRYMQADGMEIGNHTRCHLSLKKLSDADIISDITGWDKELEKNGITCHGSFCFPIFRHDWRTLNAVKKVCKRARIGCSKNLTKWFDWQSGGRGEPYSGDRYEITCSVAGKNYQVEDFIADARRSKVMVYCFHKILKIIPPRECVCNTDWTEDQFIKCLDFLKENGYKTIALKEL